MVRHIVMSPVWMESPGFFPFLPGKRPCTSHEPSGFAPRIAGMYRTGARERTPVASRIGPRVQRSSVSGATPMRDRAGWMLVGVTAAAISIPLLMASSGLG